MTKITINQQELLSSILSGSCEPATALVAAIKKGQLPYDAAFKAFNDRLRKEDRYYSLYNAAQDESDFMKYHDL